MEDMQPNIDPKETDEIIKKLEHIPIEDIGCPAWLIQRGIIEELNLQSTYCLLQQQEEYVKELILSNKKIKHIIYELIHTEFWIDKIYMIIHKVLTPDSTIFALYMVLYYESTVTNLLQVLMYHAEAVLQCDDYIIDLIDFCSRKLIWLINVSSSEHELYAEDQFGDNEFDMKKHHFRIQFGTAIRCISLIRYIIDQLKGLPLGVRAHILNVHDFPILLSEVITKKPWYRTNSKGDLLGFIDNNWIPLCGHDTTKLIKTEGQIWVSMYHLLLNKDNQEVYEITSQRQNAIVRLIKYLDSTKLDQLSLMADIRIYLENMKVIRPQNKNAKNIIIEYLPEIRDKLNKEYCTGKLEIIAKISIQKYFSPNEEEIINQARILSDQFDKISIYSNETVQEVEDMLLPPPPPPPPAAVNNKPVAPLCKKCNGPKAVKRCSRCKIAWYCRRQCQVEDWSVHSKFCQPATEEQAIANAANGIGEPGCMAIKRKNKTVC